LRRSPNCPSVLSVQMSVASIKDRQKAVERLLDNSTTDENGCWVWTGTRNTHGYGFLGIQGDYVAAHRVSAHLFLGMPLTPENLACHHCDNPPCVNPDHLFIGTHRDNMADRDAKGRTRRGEDVPAHKLTSSHVEEIRYAKANGVSVAELADRYSVSVGTISACCKGISWRHAPGPLSPTDHGYNERPQWPILAGSPKSLRPLQPKIRKRKNRWIAEYRIRRHLFHVGSFHTPEEAVSAAAIAIYKINPVFFNLKRSYQQIYSALHW